MKLKITKRTIETILWLLGQFITLMRQIAKDNKNNEYEELAMKCAENFSEDKRTILRLKKLKKEEDHEEKVSKENTKGN